MNRTNTCGDLRIGDVNHEVILQGWVKKVRKLGGMTFVDLRDRYGYTQLLISDEHKDLLETLKQETVLEVKGVVHERKTKNPNIPTGEIEVAVDTIEVINKAETLPFPIENEITTLWDTRLKYRYLDLRREVVQKNFILRSKINHLVRNYLVENNFLEIETPFFAKSTPEGARDFLVPSRLNPNKFYALPQSPQLFKQLLMVAGFDRYFQIVRCFRDEDLRVDRELEFTQLDLEMSFAHGNDVMDLVEKLLKMVLKEVDETFTDEPLAKITYAEAIEKYGSDKPDLRFDLPIQTVTTIFQNSNNKLIQEILANDKNVLRGIAVQQLLNKSQLTQLEEIAKQFNFPGILFVKFENDQWTGSLASTLSDEEKTSLKTEFNLSNNPATIILNGGEYAKVSQLFGALRNALGKMFNLYQTKFKPLWVVDFPLFEWSEEEQRFVAAHHPFTMPKAESLADFDTNKASALATAYDLVMNGFELGSGSERITDPQLQQRMFDAIGLDATQVEQNFGWFVKAYQYGAPYHAGMGLGLDRILMLLTNSENIRDVIAFPKNLSGIDPMSGSPDTVSDHQLEELHLQLVPKKDHQ